MVTTSSVGSVKKLTWALLVQSTPLTQAQFSPALVLIVVFSFGFIAKYFADCTKTTPSP